MEEWKSAGRPVLLEVDGLIARLRHAAGSPGADGLPAGQIAASLFASVVGYAEGVLRDDATLLLLRLQPDLT